MRTIDLREHTTSEPLSLSSSDRDALSRIPSLTIEPGPGDTWRLRPGSTIGALELEGMSVSIRPKLEIRRVLFLASYAMDTLAAREERFAFGETDTLVDALARAFGAAARRTFARGLLHGYRTEEAALQTVRGRIVVAEQMRRRFDLPVPVDVRYDEFTEDVMENRLVKAAASQLRRMRIRDPESSADLVWVGATLRGVSLVPFPARHAPEPSFDRLNEHYRDLVALSRLILRHGAFETTRGDLRAAGILMNMNEVFQGFVTRALREALGVSERTFRSDDNVRAALDDDGHVRLYPDLSWWDGPVCTFVGDAKYKNISGGRMPNADLYQLLAYATALDVPGGLLVYAEGEADAAVYPVRNSTKRLEVASLDLAADIDDLLDAIDRLAQRVRRLRDEARRPRHATPATLRQPA